MRSCLLVDAPGLVAIPSFVTGVCINELLIAMKTVDWLVISVVLITMGCSLLSTVRYCVPDRQFYNWGIVLVTAIAGLISLLFVILIMSKHVITESEGSILNRNRPEAQNGTDCSQLETDDSNLFACYANWVEDVKSSWSLLIGNVLVLLNATVCSRRIFQPVRQESALEEHVS